MSEQIKLEYIRRDGGTQSRAGMNGVVVYEYADLMKEGATFPDIIVFFDGKDYWLADGYHRHAAAVEAKLVSINADVRQGTQRDAVLFSVGANSTHGLRRTNDDKRRAVITLLQDEEWSKWSDREISRRTGVSPSTVSSIRQQSGVQIGQVKQRLGGDGKTYTVKHWAETSNNVMQFWDRVRRNHLNADTILSQLQKGAHQVTDLKMTLYEAQMAMNKLAIQQHQQAYPKGSFVKHNTGRFGRISSHTPDYLLVDDFRLGIEDAWMLDSFALSSREEWEAATAQEIPASVVNTEIVEALATPIRESLELGDVVKTPTGHDGTVTKIVGRLIDVKTINGTKTYRDAFLTFVSRGNVQPDSNPAEGNKYGARPWKNVATASGASLLDAGGKMVAHMHYSADALWLASLITEAVNGYHRYQSERVQRVIGVLRRVLDFEEGLAEPSPALLEDIRQVTRWLGDLDDTCEAQLNKEKVS